MDGERTAQPIEFFYFFYNEVISVRQGACDPDLVRIFVEESGERVKDLVDFEVRFKKKEDGNFLQAKECFSRL